MANLNWRDAIIKVLESAAQPMHYSDVAQLIIDRDIRKSVGATPASTVAATISTSLANEGVASPFIRVERGVYGLKSMESAASISGVVSEDEATADAREMGLINAFGMFWHRNEVNWDVAAPVMLGQQQSGSQNVDFAEQSGVYLLYDGNRVVYVGQVLGPRMSMRLREHTRDRLRGRWDRFSWFGVRDVDNAGGTLLERVS